MSIKSDVIAILTGISIYPGGAPENVDKPFVIYTVATKPVTTIHGTCPITASEFTFQCWGRTALEAETLAASLCTLIDASALCRERIDPPETGYDPQVDEYVESVSYRFWHT